MQTIHKFSLQLADVQTIVMPVGAIFRSIQVQRNEIQVWAEVNTKAEMHDVTFYTIGTGHPLPKDEGPYRYLGTIQVNNGTFVFHVFAEGLTCTAPQS